jgi:hypothetical protein
LKFSQEGDQAYVIYHDHALTINHNGDEMQFNTSCKDCRDEYNISCDYCGICKEVKETVGNSTVHYYHSSVTFNRENESIISHSSCEECRSKYTIDKDILSNNVFEDLMENLEIQGKMENLEICENPLFEIMIKMMLKSEILIKSSDLLGVEFYNEFASNFNLNSVNIEKNKSTSEDNNNKVDDDNDDDDDNKVDDDISKIFIDKILIDNLLLNNNNNKENNTKDNESKTIGINDA